MVHKYKVVCDRCHKDNKKWLAYEEGTEVTLRWQNAELCFLSKDLCKDCTEELKVWLKAFPKPKPDFNKQLDKIFPLRKKSPANIATNKGREQK